MEVVGVGHLEIQGVCEPEHWHASKPEVSLSLDWLIGASILVHAIDSRLNSQMPNLFQILLVICRPIRKILRAKKQRAKGSQTRWIIDNVISLISVDLVALIQSAKSTHSISSRAEGPQRAKSIDYLLPRARAPSERLSATGSMELREQSCSGTKISAQVLEKSILMFTSATILKDLEQTLEEQCFDHCSLSPVCNGASAESQ
jgi:hypothetical protein